MVSISLEAQDVHPLCPIEHMTSYLNHIYHPKSVSQGYTELLIYVTLDEPSLKTFRSIKIFLSTAKKEQGKKTYIY